MENILNPQAAELLVERICRRGKCLGQVPVSKEDILYVIKEEHPARYNNACDGLARDGYESLSIISKKLTADRFLGVDVVINYDGVLIAVDVTVNDQEVDFKCRKANKLRSSQELCGFDKSLVVHLFAADELTVEEEYDLLFKILDACDVLIKKDRWSDLVEYFKM